MSIEDLSAHWKDRALFAEAKVEVMEAQLVKADRALIDSFTRPTADHASHAAYLDAVKREELRRK